MWGERQKENIKERKNNWRKPISFQPGFMSHVTFSSPEICCFAGVHHISIAAEGTVAHQRASIK